MDEQRGAEHTEDTHERENNRMVERLRQQTMAVKSIALDIDDELRHHNRLLDGMVGGCGRGGSGFSSIYFFGQTKEANSWCRTSIPGLLSKAWHS